MHRATVTAVQPLEQYQLLLTFADGAVRTFDMTPYLDTGIFRELREPSIFQSVRVDFDTIEWNNGADLCPDTLYAKSVPAQPIPNAL